MDGENQPVVRALLGWLSSARPRLRQLARRPRGPGSAPPPPPGRAPPPRAGPALAPLGGSWARHPFLSPCGSARLYLSLWWCTHFCRHLPRDSGCTLFSVLRKNFSGALFRHPRLNAPHPLNPTKKAEGETSMG